MGEHDRPSVVWDYIAVHRPEQIWTDAPPQPEIFPQRERRTAMDDAAAFEHISFVRQRKHQIKTMLHDDDRQLVAQLVEQLARESGRPVVLAVETVYSSDQRALFPWISIDKAGTSYKLTATDSSLTSADSTTFDISAAAASKIAFTSATNSSTAGVESSNVTAM